MICRADNFTDACANCPQVEGLGKYAPCNSSPICGEEDIFLDQIHTFTGEFFNRDQLCVYRIVLTEYDPMDTLDDYAINTSKFDLVKMELYSMIDRGENSSLFLETSVEDSGQIWQDL